MFTYRFTAAFPEIFFELSIGAGVQVTRADAGDAPDGSTLVLYPGDEVTLDVEYPHPHLELISTPPKPAAAKPPAVQAPEAPSSEATVSVTESKE